MALTNLDLKSQRLIFPLQQNVELAPGALVTVNVSNASPAKGATLVVVNSQQMLAIVDSWTLAQKEGRALSPYVFSYWRCPFRDTHRCDARLRIHAPGPDRYSVVVLNAHGETLEIEGSVAYVNPGGQHLPLQYAHVDRTMWGTHCAFLALFAVVAAHFLMDVLWCGILGTRYSATRLLAPHALFALAILLKSLASYLGWVVFATLAEHGRVSLWRANAFILASRLQDISEKTFLLIVALGWRFLRNTLTMQETRFIRTALAVGLAASVMEVLPKETRQGLPVGAELPEGILTLGFFMCKTLTMVAIMFNQNLIGTRLLESPVTPVVVLEYHRHETYKNFSRLWMSLWLRDIIIFGLDQTFFNTQDAKWITEPENFSPLNQAVIWVVYAGLYLNFFSAVRPGKASGSLRDLVHSMQAGADAAEAPGGAAGAAAAAAGGTGVAAPAVAPPPSPAAGPAPLAQAPGAGAVRHAPVLEEGSLVPYVPLRGDE